MLQLENVSIGYKQNLVIRGLSYTFESAKIYAIVGKSGSGKSTLLKAIAAILPYSGDIRLNGEMINRSRHRLALVPQNNSLVRWKTVGYNIAFPTKNRGVFNERAMADICTELGISHLLAQYPNHISGGEVQRAALARAFLSQPDLLLLDEPFSALDTITRSEVHAVFRKTYERHKITTILITHDMEEALYLADTILPFQSGSIAESRENPFGGQSRDGLGQNYVALKKELVQAI